MSDWWPETTVQQLRRANGWRPNDGAPGINHERGDFAELEREESRPPASALPINDHGIGTLLAALRGEK